MLLAIFKIHFATYPLHQACTGIKPSQTSQGATIAEPGARTLARLRAIGQAQPPPVNATGECLRVLEGHSGQVLACAFAPGGGPLASAGDDGTVRLWDPASALPVGFVAHHFSDGSVASISASGDRVIGVSGDAWRYLGWVGSDPIHGLVRYPAETFGPLPEFQLK